MKIKLLIIIPVIAGILLTFVRINGTYGLFTVRTIINGSTFSVVDKLPEKDCTADKPTLVFEKSDEKTVKFTLQCLEQKNTKLQYSITYDSNSISQGINGNADISGKADYTSEPLTLGTCSGNDCVYHENAKNIHLTVELYLQDNKILTLEHTLP